MTDRVALLDGLTGSETQILATFPRLLDGLSEAELLELLGLLEDPGLFKGRLPLRLKLYAIVFEEAESPELRMIALLRLLRRMGSRKDMPELGDIPGTLPDFADYLQAASRVILRDEMLGDAIASLAASSRAFRSGDLNVMLLCTSGGLKALCGVELWSDPPDVPGLASLLVAETGNELYFIAVNAQYRSGKIEEAKTLLEDWSKAINAWEQILGPLERVRYQYYQLVGHISNDAGLPAQALKAYSTALDYAPTAYRKAFLWMSIAQVERETGLLDESWDHGVQAIEAWLASPYPQTAVTWIEWLSMEADTPEKRDFIVVLRERCEIEGGQDINRVSRAMASLYRLKGFYRDGMDPSHFSAKLEQLADELEEAGSWPNLVTILATLVVALGRQGSQESMERAVERAREIVETKLEPDARPPAEFFLESAYALALRDTGAYDEAFNALFERALEARLKYPGAVGPDEQTALEALYYLGALAGQDPAVIEKKVRAVISKIG